MAIRFRLVKMHFHESLRGYIDNIFHADLLIADALTGYGVTDIQGNPCARTPSPFEKGPWIGCGTPAKIFQADGHADFFSVFDEPGEVFYDAMVIHGQGSIQSHVNGHQWLTDILHILHGFEMELHGVFGGLGMGVPDFLSRKIAMVPYCHAAMDVGNELS